MARYRGRHRQKQPRFRRLVSGAVVGCFTIALVVGMPYVISRGVPTPATAITNPDAVEFSAAEPVIDPIAIEPDYSDVRDSVPVTPITPEPTQPPVEYVEQPIEQLVEEPVEQSVPPVEEPVEEVAAEPEVPEVQPFESCEDAIAEGVTEPIPSDSEFFNVELDVDGDGYACDRRGDTVVEEVPEEIVVEEEAPAPPEPPADVAVEQQCPENTEGFGPVKDHVRGAGLLLRCEFGVETMIGVASRSGASDHPTGLALDFMVDSEVGDQLAESAVARMDELSIKYVIWEQRINHGNGWEPMEDRGTATANHFDHVHVSFRDGPSGVLDELLATVGLS